MDTQILEELVALRWTVTVIAITVGVFAVAYIVALAVNFSRALESVNTNDFFNRGNALLMKGELDDLIKRCAKHLLNFPSDAGAYWLKGTAHYRLKEWNQALVCYRKVDELQPGYAVGPSIAEIEEKIAAVGTSPDLKIVAGVTQIHKPASPKDGSPDDVDTSHR